MYHVYILLCDKQNFYIGITKELEKRLREHQSGFSPYTERYKSVELIYFERHLNRFSAEKRERQLKGWSKAKKQALIDGDIEKLVGLSKSRS